MDLSAKTHIIEVIDTKKQYPLIRKLRGKKNELFHYSVEKKR